jgi:hypothetical protein
MNIQSTPPLNEFRDDARKAGEHARSAATKALGASGQASHVASRLSIACDESSAREDRAGALFRLAEIAEDSFQLTDASFALRAAATALESDSSISRLDEESQRALEELVDCVVLELRRALESATAAGEAATEICGSAPSAGGLSARLEALISPNAAAFSAALSDFNLKRASERSDFSAFLRSGQDVPDQSAPWIQGFLFAVSDAQDAAGLAKMAAHSCARVLAILN